MMQLSQLTTIAFILAAVFFTLVVFYYAKLNRTRLMLSEALGETRLLQARLADRTLHEEALKTAARSEFENLAQTIIERESRQFQESSEKGLEKLLTPLKERIKDFEKKVDDNYQNEGRERFVLKAEVERLVKLNERMAEETNSLTHALRGDSKFQGDWGELILENILESSGLREGQEYILQKNLTGQGGANYRPDVVIHLPDGKQIIVDSKVSLTAYESLSRLETTDFTGAAGSLDLEKQRYLKAHLESLSRHVDELSEKHYPKLKGLKTPEFVFLFTPIEPAYFLAMRHDPQLALRAWKKGVAIVTSTTLFSSLKTVASIWRLEHQNRNAQEIADEAAKLYDKFVGFHEDFEKIGKVFENGLNQYDEAKRKLRDGPGNVFRRIELLRELGAAPNKRIKPELLE
jgi:DNA recombination protein RmuC